MTDQPTLGPDEPQPVPFNGLAQPDVDPSDPRHQAPAPAPSPTPTPAPQ